MLIYNVASDVYHPQQGHCLEHISAHDRFVLRDEKNQMCYLYTGRPPERNAMDLYRIFVYRVLICRSRKVRILSFYHLF